MPKKPSGRILINSEWDVQELRTASTRRGGGAAADPFIEKLTIPSRLEVQRTVQASARGRRTAESLPPLHLSFPADPAADYILAVRHPSGALTFHLSAERTRRRGAVPGAHVVTFHVEFPPAETEEVANARRSMVSAAVKGVVLKVSGKLADLALPKLIGMFEKLQWQKKHLKQGWLQVTPEALRSNNFADADFSRIKSAADRCLLLLHGTFSNAAGAYADLATTKGASEGEFFPALRSIYDDRIFAFNHFTLSKTPEENAKDLLAGLPKAATFDVITHSRGGLVLRHLVEMSSSLGADAKRFQLGKAVLVASPNHGTPLATPSRWETTVGWIANVAELFPENPATLTIEFVSEALVWLAKRASGGVPGLGAMDMNGKLIEQLESAPPPPPGHYSALVANFLPDQNLLLRMADVGVNTFFRGACDLVVPSEGGWQVGAAPTVIPAAQIACFGKGGNISPEVNVVHTGFFSQSQTVDFLIEALSGKPHTFPVLNPAVTLPSRGLRAVAASAVASKAAPSLPEAATTPSPEVSAPVQPFSLASENEAVLAPPRHGLGTAGVEADEVFQLFMISSDDPAPEGLEEEDRKKTKGAASRRPRRTALLLAAFRNARVVEKVILRGTGDDPKEGGARWHEIIKVNEGIKDYINGSPSAPPLPHREGLQQFGVELFETVFPRNIRRLYDVARADVAFRGHRLDIVMTSMINWVADKPWEFAYDPNRQTFLATEDVNFTRNVLTSVPSDAPNKHKGPMRILIVVAQPVGMGLLSATDEEKVILRGFRHLIDAKLATVDVMLSATANLLHQRLEFGNYDVVHFIGHGEYDPQKREGCLLFENADGGAQRVSAESLREILCHRNLRLIFLNACETGMVGRSQSQFDFNQGVAPKLVAGGIPAVVANQYKVLDVSATEFARRFYWSLAQGSAVGDAAREARVAVNYSIAGECIDWAVPVVYARNPCQALFAPVAAPEPLRDALKETQGRRAVPRAAVRIGLWDVNHVVPSLESIADRINSLQTVYSFEMADITAPLGTWRLIPGKDTATARGVILGRVVSSKLHGQVTGLGINRLFCITTFVVADTFDSEYIEQLSLWNNDPEGRITIISGAGLFDVMDSEYPVGRFICNSIANALSNVDDHKGPPRSCPNFFQKKHLNPPDRLDYTTGRQRLCAACKAKMDPEKRKALQSILDAF